MSLGRVTWRRPDGIGLLSDVLAGSIVAASNVALAAGFAAVIMQGDLAPGFPTAMWAILVSMIVTGVVVGLMTSLSPVVAGGPDTAMVAVLSLLANAVASKMALIEASVDAIATHVLVAVTLIAVLYGGALCLLGFMRRATALRFVPFPLIGGFLATTGALLLASSPEIVLGAPVSVDVLSLPLGSDLGLQILFMTGVFAVLAISSHVLKSAFVMPVSFFAAVGLCHLGIQAGLIEGADWFVASASALEPWGPFAVIAGGGIDWSVLVAAWPEIAACVLVGLFSLVVRISTFEAMRKRATDMNGEFRAYGLANLLTAPVGGMPGGILFSSSKLIEVAGYRTPLCYGVMAALLLSIVAFGVDLSLLLPKAALGGLLLFLGYTMAIEAFRLAFTQRAISDIALTAGIFLICMRFGFVAGAIAGILAACLVFALNCSRIGVVRRHFTRAAVSGGAEWPSDVEAHLREVGDSIHLYELSGYIFFGSAEGLFEDIRSRVMGQTDPPVRFIVLDLSLVSGRDSSAANTMRKLQGLAERHGIMICFCGVPEPQERTAKRRELQPSRVSRLFPNRLEALYWCERRLLETLPAAATGANEADFRLWLSDEIGLDVDEETLSRTFAKRGYQAGEQVYAQGTDADTMDFIARGVAVMRLTTGSLSQTIRRSTRRTVIGEMGFFRGTSRTLSVFADEDLLVYSLTRERLEDLQRRSPALHAAILEYIIRILSDRVEAANREISELR